MTIRELAEELGVSKSTVSYALRNDPRVAAKTRDWILGRAGELGFNANPLTASFLKQVRSGRTPTVKAKLAIITSGQVANIYEQLASQGFRRRANSFGLSVTEITCEQLTSPKQSRVLQRKQIVAAALMAPFDAEPCIAWSDYALTTLGYHTRQPRLHLVGHHYFSGVRLAVNHCREAGCERIGIALSEASHQLSNCMWRAGYLEAQHLCPSKNRVPPLIASNEQCSPESIADWARKKRLDALLFDSSRVELASLVKALPASIMPASLNRAPDEACAGVDQCYERQGSLMADITLRQLIHNERGIPDTPTLNLLEGEWVEQPS